MIRAFGYAAAIVMGAIVGFYLLVALFWTAVVVVLKVFG